MVQHRNLTLVHLHHPMGSSAVGALPLVDNTASAYLIENATSGANYIQIDTTTSANVMMFGNATTNPIFQWHGSGTWSVGGGTGSAGQVLTASGPGAAPTWATITGAGWTDDGAVVRLTTASDTVGIGTTATDSKLHVMAASAGTATATANTVLTVENSSHAYISIVASGTNKGLYFGGPAASGWTETDCGIVYDNSADRITVSTDNQTAFIVGRSVATYGADMTFSSASPTQPTKMYLTQAVSIVNNPRLFHAVSAAHTTLTNGETICVLWDLAATVQTAVGSYATQRAFRITAPTYAFATSSSTITTASTFAISGAPIAGTNAVFTNAYALNVESGASYFGGDVVFGGTLYSVGAGANSLRYGQSTAAAGANAIAIGSGASASHTSSIAIGRNAASVAADYLTLGSEAYYINAITFGPTTWTGATPLSFGVLLPTAGGTDATGSNLEIHIGRGTGAGSSGSLYFYAGDVGSSGTTAHTNRARFQMDGATGNLAVCQRGGTTSLGLQSLQESTTLSGATTDTTIQIPANSLVVFVTAEVTTTITGCTTWDYGIAGATTRFGTGLALTATTESAGLDSGGSARYYTSAAAVRFTAVGGGASFSGGVVRLTIYYFNNSP